jgi:hypothetical protein
LEKRKVFKLAAVKKVTWPVVVQIPIDHGKVQKAEFDAEFEILEQSEHDELVNAGGDLIERVLVGWARVKDEDGNQDINFGPEQKRQMLGITYARIALLKAYYEACQGRKAERKN